MRARELFMGQVRDAQNLNMGILTMPAYSEPAMTNAEANAADWRTFKTKIQPAPLRVVGSQVSDIEYMISPKNTAWGVEDLVIFAGANERQINELDELNTSEGEEFLDLNFTLAQELMRNGQATEAAVAIGFNQGDFSAGHHTLNRLHSHLRTLGHPYDVKRRTQFSWTQLDRFDRMAFIEPFSNLFHDFVTHSVQTGLFAGRLMGAPEHRLGYTSLMCEVADIAGIFGDLRQLYREMREEYGAAAAIFTDGRRDETLDRFIPLPQAERLRQLGAFLTEREGLYSETSVNALNYLVERLRPAEPRDPENPRDMSTTGKIYATRGFAGALHFTFTESHGVRLDILPRVITTSGITKTILGAAFPTVIAKTKSPASNEERAITDDFHRRVSSILDAYTLKQL